MIFVIVLLVLTVLVVLFFLLLSNKSKKIGNMRVDYEQYKDSIQDEIVGLRSKEATLNILLEQEKQKTVELKGDVVQRLDELKQELKSEQEKSYGYIEEIKEYKSQISRLDTQLKEQKNAMQEKLELLQNSEARFKTEFENLANKIFEDNSKKLNERNQESLINVLNPVRDQLKDFKQNYRLR